MRYEISVLYDIAPFQLWDVLVGVNFTSPGSMCRKHSVYFSTPMHIAYFDTSSETPCSVRAVSFHAFAILGAYTT